MRRLAFLSFAVIQALRHGGPTIDIEEQLARRREQLKTLRSALAKSGKLKPAPSLPVDRPPLKLKHIPLASAAKDSQKSIDVLREVLGPRAIPTFPPPDNEANAFKLLGSGDYPPSNDHWVAALPSIDASLNPTGPHETLSAIFGLGTSEQPKAPPPYFISSRPVDSPFGDAVETVQAAVLHAPPGEPSIPKIPPLFNTDSSSSSPTLPPAKYPDVAYPSDNFPDTSDGSNDSSDRVLSNDVPGGPGQIFSVSEDPDSPTDTPSDDVHSVTLHPPESTESNAVSVLESRESTAPRKSTVPPHQDFFSSLPPAQSTDPVDSTPTGHPANTPIAPRKGGTADIGSWNVAGSLASLGSLRKKAHLWRRATRGAAVGGAGAPIGDRQEVLAKLTAE